MSAQEVAKSFVTFAEGLAKSLWVVVLVLLLWALAFASDNTLRAIGERLELAGITTLKTPVGDINTKQIGQLKVASDQSAVSVAVLNEIAQKELDPAKKKALEDIAKNLTQQQEVQLNVADRLTGRLKSAPEQARSKDSAAFHERWLFVGRYSEGAWRPLSFSIGQAPFPLKPGARVSVKGEALLYGDSDCEGKTTPSPVYEAARPTAAGLEVVSEQVLCPSIGGAHTVWVKVRVPPELFVSR